MTPETCRADGAASCPVAPAHMTLRCRNRHRLSSTSSFASRSSGPPRAFGCVRRIPPSLAEWVRAASSPCASRSSSAARRSSSSIFSQGRRRASRPAPSRRPSSRSRARRRRAGPTPRLDQIPGAVSIPLLGSDRNRCASQPAARRVPGSQASVRRVRTGSNPPSSIASCVPSRTTRSASAVRVGRTNRPRASLL